MSDLISRQAAIGLKTIAPIAPVMNGETVHYEEVVFVRDLEKLTPVEPERKPGYWTHDDDGWECGACHIKIREDDFPTSMGAPIYNYCPLCGEDMRGVENGNI
jgi:hypothetical protein